MLKKQMLFRKTIALYYQKPNKEALYYMRSRGLSEKEAVSVLKQAFLTEITDLIKIDPVREKVEQLLVDKFKEFTETNSELLN
jgi:hypothetical protein